MARCLAFLVLAAAAVSMASAFQASFPSSACRVANGLGHRPLLHSSSWGREAAAAPPTTAAAAAGSLSAARVTSWEEQEQQGGGFVPPPPQVKTLIDRVRGKAEGEPLLFEETLKAMEACYDYTPRRFVNGDLESTEGTNAGSCKLLSLGILHGLDVATLLKLFGEHYRSVIRTPQGSDHGNIRNMIKSGWKGVAFPDGLGLAVKE